MKVYEDYKGYLEALHASKAPGQIAILPMDAAASLLMREERTIKEWVRTERLPGIKVGKDVFPLAMAVHAYVVEREEEAKRLYQRLVDHVLNDGSVIFYSDLMDEFGYNYRLSSDRLHFGYLLGECSRISKEMMELEGFADEGYFISAFVWRKPARGKEPNEIGPGFWGLVWNLMGEEPAEGDKLSYVKKHMKKCIKFYRNM